MRTLTGKGFARLIEEHGWRLLRFDGSHHIYGKDGEAAGLSVLIHGNQPLKAGLQRHLARLAGLSDADLG